MYGTPGSLGRGGKIAGNTGGASVPARRLTLPYSPYQCSARTSSRPPGRPPNFSRSKSRSYSLRPVYLKTLPWPSGAGNGLSTPPAMPNPNCVTRPPKVIPASLVENT